MITKGNRIENWTASYEQLPTTYSEKLSTPADLANLCQFEFVYEDIRKFLPDVPNPRVLEVGCGGARTSLYLAKRGINVTCADFTPEALRLARSNFDAEHASGTFVLDDLMNSNLPAHSFDCVMSFGLLEHFEDLKPLVANMTRLVAPGGIQIHAIIPKKFSTQVLMNLALFPFRFVYFGLQGRFKGLVTRSYRDFPHFENRFSAVEYGRAFEAGGNQILRNEAAGVMFPFILLPMGLGNLLVRAFGGPLAAITRRLDRTESKVLHFLAPVFYIVSRYVGPGGRQA
jgi:2-polyprenyl-3-methyl-5-hydroxy-6-metoxy-1,4-benzoquinol methylase